MMHRLLAAVGVSLVVSVMAAAQTPLGTAFTYQGVLKTGSAPVNGAADLRFMLFDAASAGNQVGATMEYPAWPIVDGLFTLTLDFGALVFNGDERWLQIEVRAPAGSGSYVALTPRQRMAAAPYALRALNASISGVQPAALTFSNATNAYSGATLDIDSGTLHVDAANNRVGIGVLAPSHALTIATAADPYALRLIGPYGTFQHGARMNFGDGDYAYIDEYVDDGLHLHANHLLITTDTIGDNAVYLPTGSVSATETANEPGLAHVKQPGTFISLNSTWLPVATATINCPAPGFVIATYTAEFVISGVSPGVNLEILPTTMSLPSTSQHTFGNTTITLTIHRVFVVEEAGPYSYHVVAQGTGSSITTKVWDPYFTLLYVPTAYGSVDP